MNFPVTLATDYECFPPLGFHGGFPCGIAQFIEVANNVHLYQFGHSSTTEFADSGIQALPYCGLPVVLPPLIDYVGSVTSLAIGYLYGTNTLSSMHSLIRD